MSRRLWPQPRLSCCVSRLAGTYEAQAGYVGEKDHESVSQLCVRDIERHPNRICRDVPDQAAGLSTIVIGTC